MMGHQTAAESRAENIAKMGQALGTQYSALWQEIAQLHFNWKEYVELFGTKPERIELLNKAAPAFFRMLQDDLWDASLLHIARLTDQPSSFGRKGKENLSIRNLPALIDDVNAKAKVAALVDIAVKGTEFCRDWRNRRIAHRDLRLVLEPQATPLEPASRAHVKSALVALAGVLNGVQAHYFDSETGFDIGGRIDGAVSLLYVIDDGVRARAKREERVRSGNYTQEDFAAKDV